MFTAACPEYLNLQIFGYDLGQAVVGIAEYIYGCSIFQIAQAQAAYHLLFIFCCLKIRFLYGCRKQIRANRLCAVIDDDDSCFSLFFFFLFW